MIAALQMYDWPEVREATDLWWKGIAGHMGLDLPLSRPDEFTAPWLRDDLLFGQTCGYPFTHALTGQVRLVVNAVGWVAGIGARQSGSEQRGVRWRSARTMAADTMGTESRMSRANTAEVSAFWGSTSEAAGNNITSSNVRPGGPNLALKAESRDPLSLPSSAA